jgi:predicted O-methyltransferase YrrM
MISDPRIQSAIDELEALRSQRKDHWQIPLVEGRLLHHIALSMGARYIVEVGTSYGFSGLFWGDVMKRNDGHLHTIDIDPKKYDSSKLTFAQAGLNEVITNHLGQAADVIPRLPDGIDIAFIDADKPATRQYFDLLWPKLRPGGSIIIDNATTHRDEFRPLIQHLRSLNGASSTEVAVGNGIEWVIKTT